MKARLPFSEADLPRVQTFECGAKLFQIEVSDWIKSPSTSPNSALGDMQARGTLVWLYETDDEIIGFGSLGATNWSIPNRQTGKKTITRFNAGICGWCRNAAKVR